MLNESSSNKKVVEQVTLDNGIEEVRSIVDKSSSKKSKTNIDASVSSTPVPVKSNDKKRAPGIKSVAKGEAKQSPLYLHNNKLCGCYIEAARVWTPPKEERDLYGSQGSPKVTGVETSSPASTTSVSAASTSGRSSSSASVAAAPSLEVEEYKKKNWFLINFCIYQPFLDGWDFTPDVGMGSTRGEIFTPRFIVDYMISDVGILPERMVYNFDYKSYKKKFEDKQNELRGYAGARVFEPAVGTGNYISSVLWHKLEIAHELTGYKSYKRNGKVYYSKNIEQLARYQAYTLVILGSLYFNDIDPGNLQTTKWRTLRDSEISNPKNVDFWVSHIKENLSQELDRTQSKWLKDYVQESINTASANWASKDKDRGVLDVLYEKHTGEHSPDWLRAAWRRILDANAQLFNGIKSEDVVEKGFVVPGNQNIIWTYWSFVYEVSPLNEADIQELSFRSSRPISEIIELGLDKSLERMSGLRKAVPLLRQMLVGEREEAQTTLDNIFSVLRDSVKSKAAKDSMDTSDGERPPVFTISSTAAPRGKKKKQDKNEGLMPLFEVEEVQEEIKGANLNEYKLDEESLFLSADPSTQKQIRQLKSNLNKTNARLLECPEVRQLNDIVFYNKRNINT